MSFPTRPYRFGAFEVDPRSGEVRKNGVRIRVQDKSFQVLIKLLENQGEVVTREELQSALWPADTFVEFETGLNTAIRRLREALGDSADRPVFIETLPRRGYRLITPVTLPATQSAVPVSSDSDFPAEPSLPHRHQRYLAVAGVGLLLALLVLYFYQSRVRWRGPDLQKMQIERLTDSGNVAYVAISPDGRYVVYALRRPEGLGLWTRQVATHSDVQILPPEKVDFRGPTFSPDGNYIYFARSDKHNQFYLSLYSMPVLGGPTKLILRDIHTAISFSPNGKRFVFTRYLPTSATLEVRLANADGSHEQLLVSRHPSDGAAGATWAPDGKSVALSWACSGKSQRWVLEVVSVNDSAGHELYSSAFAIGRPLWLPKKDALLVVINDQYDRGQFWTVSYPEGQAHRLTNDLSTYVDDRVDLTPDGKTAAVISWNELFNVWEDSGSAEGSARQITFGGPALDFITESASGRLLATTSPEGKLVLVSADGRNREPFGDVDHAAFPSWCGKFVVFDSEQADTTDLVRVDVDGANATKLTSGPLWSPSCSPDGKFVYYVNLDQPQKIARIPIEGGAASEIGPVGGDSIGGSLRVSPDGKFLAYIYSESKPEPSFSLVLIPAGGGSALKSFKGPSGVLRWSPDGKSLDYTRFENGAANVWEQRLEGGEPKQLTRFPSGQIADFNWSADGKRLLITRGDVASDVVLLTNLY